MKRARAMKSAWYSSTSSTSETSAARACNPSGLTMVTAQDVTSLVSFLAGDHSTYLSGAVIPLDGRALGGNTYRIHITAPVGSNPIDIGRELISYIDAYETNGGRRRA
mgnify:CR=1 FL=1